MVSDRSKYIIINNFPLSHNVMSVDLLAELASLRQCILTSKDDLNRYRGSHTDACLATVLGSAEQAGIMQQDIAIATCEDNSVLASLLESCDDSAAAKESIAGVMVAVAAAAANHPHYH